MIDPHIVRVLLRRELRDQWHDARGWWLLCAWLLVAGLLWAGLLSAFLLDSAAGSSLRDPTMQQLVVPWCGNLTVILLVMVPALSMRSFAEERAVGRLAHLLLSPAKPTEVLLAKLLALAVSVGVLVGTAALFPITIMGWGDLDPRWTTVALGALFVQGVLCSMWGALASLSCRTLTQAFLLSFSGCVLWWLLGWVDPSPTSLASQLSLSGHLRDPLQGVIKISDLAWLLGAGVVLWVAALERLRLEPWT